MRENHEPGSLAFEVEDLKRRLTSLEASIASLVKAWEAAGSVLTAVKWATLVLAGLATFWTAVKAGILHK